MKVPENKSVQMGFRMTPTIADKLQRYVKKNGFKNANQAISVIIGRLKA